MHSPILDGSLTAALILGAFLTVIDRWHQVAKPRQGSPVAELQRVSPVAELQRVSPVAELQSVWHGYPRALYRLQAIDKKSTDTDLVDPLGRGFSLKQAWHGNSNRVLQPKTKVGSK